MCLSYISGVKGYNLNLKKNNFIFDTKQMESHISTQVSDIYSVCRNLSNTPLNLPTNILWSIASNYKACFNQTF